jgi:hypothetical protein
MNNLLKIFLIFNLISSTTSTSVNNHSLPLLEENLMVGQNSSELVERGESITLVGGTPVVGISSGSGGSSQIHCTFSFPVVRKSDGKKGFLTSFDCGDDYFVSDTKIGDGSDNGPGTFSPSKGIDYHFVKVYSDYWSDEISQKILYSQCGSTCSGKVLIPLLSIPNEPPRLNSKVCAYGGASGYVCGVIMDFDATITVRKDVPFHQVTKVKMEKPCLGGDVGAPVYIYAQAPNSNQIAASPVGQVMKDEKDSEANM